MPRSHFRVLAKNPNTRGGCLCSPSKLVDCTGPYICFTGPEMMDVRDSVPVLSIGCALVAVRKVAKRSDAPAELRPAEAEPAVEPEAPSIEDYSPEELLAELTSRVAPPAAV